MEKENRLKKNPSRETCENIIRRILMAEIAEKGSNTYFRQSTDFMKYFESLYPASDSLTKQVQRAVKAMDMPKDENGYFIINRTKEQLAQEMELKHLMKQGYFALHNMSQYETIFIEAPADCLDYLVHKLSTWELLQGKYVTMLKTCNGVLIYTKDKSILSPLIDSIMV